MYSPPQILTLVEGLESGLRVGVEPQSCNMSSIHRIKTATSKSGQHDMPMLGDHIRGLGDCRVERQLRGRSTYPEFPCRYREHGLEYEGEEERSSKLLRRVGFADITPIMDNQMEKTNGK